MVLSGCTGASNDNMEEKIDGCMDSDAINYDPSAEIEDESCTYTDSDSDGIYDKDEIAGCMDEEANNFDLDATDADSSCTYDVAWQSEYGATWEQHETDEDCKCSDGSNFSFWSRDADPSRVVLYFQGGGACWESYGCQMEGGTYKTTTGGWDDPTELSENLSDTGGMFNFYNEENPLADWSFIFVPYCTGDLHLGTIIGEYNDNNVNHSGHANAQTAYAYMLENYPELDRVLVSGSSAGSIPTPFYAALASEDYPDSDISAFIDASGGLLSNGTYDFYNIWGLNDSLSDFPMQPLNFNQMTSADLAIKSWNSNNTNTINLARFDNAYDDTMRYFNALLDNDPLMDYQQQVLDSEAMIEDAGVPISAYLAPGDGHTILGRDVFYTQNVEGVVFVDWFTAFLNGEAPEDVHCVECD